jgi:hypothetical protein
LSKLVYGVASAEYEVSWGDSSARGDGAQEGAVEVHEGMGSMPWCWCLTARLFFEVAR